MEKPETKTGFRILPLLALLTYTVLFAVFYQIYVPLILPFQLVLIPLLVLTAVLTFLDQRWGVLWFVFAFPLINILPYLCGIKGYNPHAPTALVLFLALLWGWGLRSCFASSLRIRWDHTLHRPLLVFSTVMLISAVITGFRYLNFYPFKIEGIYELIVNVNGVRSGGAVMSSLFNLLNYATGFLFFSLIYTLCRSQDFLKKVLKSLLYSGGVVLIFALVQRFVSLSLGNTRFFVNLERLNATLKDPNSLGVFLACFIPLVLGMALAFTPSLRYGAFLVLIGALVVFPWAGSRSGLLGLALGLALFLGFVLISSRLPMRRKWLWGSAVVVALLLAGVGLAVVSGGTNLYQRFAGNIEALSGRSALKRILDPGRVRLWEEAGRMMLSYPASGVGVGGFIIEFPNYNTVEQSLRFHTDSAENYVLQAGAEMGLWGAGLALWILIELLRLILRGRRPREREDSLRFIRFGIRAGLAAVLVNLLFHSYIGAFDAKYLLWLLAGLLAGLNRLERPGERDRPISRGFITAAVLVGLIYGGNLLWHSTHSLSLPRSAERHGFSQNFGLYQTEQDNQGRSFSWSKKTAGLTFPNTGGKLRLPIRASHPGIEKYPVTVTVYQADAYFRKQRRLEDLKLDHSRWKEYTLTLSGFEGPQLFLIFEVSRLWQPQKYLGSSDTRWLGIAIGEPH